MECIGVGIREILMTRSALVRDLCHELVLLDLLDLVSGVAIFTVRQFLCGIGRWWGMDAGGEFFIDTLMASGAGCSQVLEMNGRLLDRVVQDIVRVVAVRTYGTGKQSFLDQATAVNTAGIIHEDVSSRYWRLRRRQLSVAITAELRNPGAVGLVALIEVRHNLMFSMAICTIGRFWILLDVPLPMIAVEVIFSDLSMTVGAVHPARRLTGAVPPGVDIRMTLHAGNISVHGILDILFQNSERNLLANRDLMKVRLLVAFQAFAVGSAQDQARPPDLMRMVAIGTRRDRPHLLFPKFPLDDFDMDFFDPGVTLSTGLGDVLRRDGRIRIRVRKDEMIPMAVVARSRHGEASPEQAFAVDALGIVAQDLFFRNVVDTGDRRTLSMARSAKERDVHLVSFRPDVRRGQSIVSAVALFAGGGVRGSSFESLAVDPG